MSALFSLSSSIDAQLAALLGGSFTADIDAALESAVAAVDQAAVAREAARAVAFLNRMERSGLSHRLAIRATQQFINPRGCY